MVASQERWEYLFVHIGHASGFREVTWRPFKVNRKPLPAWEKGPHWQDYFQELGTQGWEFVTFEDSFIDDKIVGGKVAIFKRRIVREPEVRRIAQREENAEHKPPFIFEP